MTPEAFLAIHLQANPTVIGPGQINVNVDFLENVPPNYAYGNLGPQTDMYILNVAINAFAFLDGEGEVITEILQQVETIRFTFQGIPCTLEVLDFTSHEVLGNQFFFYTVQPFLIENGLNVITSAAQPPFNQEPWPDGFALQLNTIIDFTPFLQDVNGLLAEYSILNNNAFENRKSYKIRESQRIQSTIVPTNFGPIYSGSATPADIQDSLYYDTGWTNGRYNGSLSTPKNYAGVPPSLTGKAFTGEAYANVTDNDFICAVPYDVRVFEEFFHTGDGIYPAYEEIDLQINIAQGGGLNTNAVSFLYSGIPQSSSLDVGDIIIIGNEKMRVLDNSDNDKRLTVQRAYFGTTQPVAHSNLAPVKKIARVDLFRFSESNAQIVQADNAKVYVRETGHVLFTDIFGTVANFITCSINFVTIDDPGAD